MDTRTGRILSGAARWVLAAVFIAAALPKLGDPDSFAAAVAGYRILTPELAAVVAGTLPGLELVVAVGLLLPALRRASGLCLAAMLLGFAALHLSAWARGLDPACGCFGGEAAAGPRGALLNLLLFALLLPVLRRDFRRAGNRNPSQTER